MIKEEIHINYFSFLAWLNPYHNYKNKYHLEDFKIFIIVIGFYNLNPKTDLNLPLVRYKGWQ
jgi:hypothetical protein